jgi:hypothetical protein
VEEMMENLWFIRSQSGSQIRGVQPTCAQVQETAPSQHVARSGPHVFSKSAQPRRWCAWFLLLVAGVLICAAASPAVAQEPAAMSQAVGNAEQTYHLVMMIVYASIALIFSFLCSVAEAVLLSVTVSYIASLEQAGKKIAGLLSKMKSDIDRSLAAILTLNTIAHTLGAGGAGAQAAAYFHDKYVGITMAVLTLLILFFSEIVPKTLGAIYWRRLAPITAHFVRALVWLLFPLIVVSELITKWISRGQEVHVLRQDSILGSGQHRMTGRRPPQRLAAAGSGNGWDSWSLA